jgi:hypothetical protein
LVYRSAVLEAVEKGSWRYALSRTAYRGRLDALNHVLLYKVSKDITFIDGLFGA